MDIHLSELTAHLPGPSRRRSSTTYSYRLKYRNPNVGAPGCALQWEVSGGRMPYQISLEREENGSLRLHCTCADAVYRGENGPHTCKHVRGLLAVSRQPLVETGDAESVRPAVA
jgi:hypothetical protein